MRWWPWAARRTSTISRTCKEDRHGAHHQPAKSADHPPAQAGAEKRPAGPRGYSSVKGSSWWGEALRWGPPPELLVVAEGTGPPAELPAGVRVVEVPEALLRAVSTVESPPGHAGRVPDAGHRSAGDAAGGPPAGAGRGAGPRQRGHRLAHRRRLRGGGAVPAARLRRALCPQDGARHHGGLLPPAGVGGDAGGSDRPAGPVGPSPVRRRPADDTEDHPAPFPWAAPPWSSAARAGGVPAGAGRLPGDFENPRCGTAASPSTPPWRRLWCSGRAGAEPGRPSGRPHSGGTARWRGTEQDNNRKEAIPWLR